MFIAALGIVILMTLLVRHFCVPFGRDQIERV